MLKINSKGDEVKDLQSKLKALGFTGKNGASLVIDGDFGPNTEYAVKEFQRKYGITPDGIVGPMTLDKLSYALGGSQYKKIRMFETDVHVYETKSDEFVDVELGQVGKLEPLSKIKKSGYVVTAAINGGFFNFDGSSEHLGLYIDEGKYYKPPSGTYANLIYYKDGTTDIRLIGDMNEIPKIQTTAHWAIGAPWVLMKNGEINLLGANIFDHSAYKEPRTLLGHKKDGTWVLVVVQGRKPNNPGMTAKQCAELMKSLGCHNAINLDGGGSSEMIVNNKIMNIPTDGKERNIGSAVLVLKKKVDETYRVCIDPGHGGTERANKGPTGYVEADGVLAISKYLRSELLSTGRFEVMLTRETDMTLSLTERAKKAIDFKADLFISQHTNAYNKTTRGVEVFESVQLPDEAFADRISAEISSVLEIPNRRGKSRESATRPGRDHYTVIDVVAAGGVPHVLLVESAFHDNLQDEALLKQDSNLIKIAQVQAKVICDFFGVPYQATKAPPTPTVKMLTPDSCTLVQGTQITVTGEASNCDHNAVYVDGTWIAGNSGNNCTYKLTLDKPGTHVIELRGRNTASDKEPGTMLASDQVEIKVVAPANEVPEAEIQNINASIRYLKKYFDVF